MLNVQRDLSFDCDYQFLVSQKTESLIYSFTMVINFHHKANFLIFFKLSHLNIQTAGENEGTLEQSHYLTSHNTHGEKFSKKCKKMVPVSPCL